MKNIIIIIAIGAIIIFIFRNKIKNLLGIETETKRPGFQKSIRPQHRGRIIGGAGRRGGNVQSHRVVDVLLHRENVQPQWRIEHV